MPRLPTSIDVDTVSPRVTADPGVSAPVGAFQSPLGIAATELAPGFEKLGQEIHKKELVDDEIELVNARTRLLQFGERELYDPQQGLLTKKGQGAKQAQVDLEKRTDAEIASVMKGLSRDDQRKSFNVIAQHWRTGLSTDASRYVLGENQRHIDASEKSQIVMSNRTAANTATLGNWDGVNDEWMAQKILLHAEATRKGFDDTQRNDLIAGARSEFHTIIAEQLVSNNKLNNARKYFETNKSEIDTDTQLKLENLFKSRTNEVASEMRVSITDRMQDLEAMGQRGILPPKGFISDSEINTAYAEHPERAAQIKRRRDEGYGFATAANTLHAENNDALVGRVRAPEPSAIGENFAEQARHNDMLRVMSTNILKQRLTAPMDYAAQQKIGVVNDIDFSSPNAAALEIGNRQKTAKLMQDRFGSPIQLLTAQEAATFSRSLSQATPAQKRQTFQSFAGALGDDMVSYRSLMGQIAPDDPVTAMAGISANRKEATQQGQYVADLLLRGQAILHPPKKTDGSPDHGSLIPMPPEKSLREEFDSTARDAFTGMADTVRNQYYQASRAIYASLSMDAGDKDTQNLNNDRWEEAIQLATGGIEKYNGKRTLMPFGYEKSQFKQEMKSHILALKDQIPEGLSVDKLSDLPVVPYGDGRYVFMVGNSVLGDKNGNRIVIDLNQKLPPPPSEAGIAQRARYGRGFGAQ